MVNKNHEGIAVISKPGIRVTKMPLKLCVTTFEYLCHRATTGSTSTILIVMYRPGSVSPSLAFFAKFTTRLKLMSSFSLLVTITADVNTHLQNQNEANTKKISVIINVFGMGQVQHVLLPTHEHGDILDIVISSSGRPTARIAVDDVGLSDHMLMSWTVNTLDAKLFFCQTPVGGDLIFSMLLLGADFIFANLPPGADLFFEPGKRRDPSRASCL